MNHEASESIVILDKEVVGWWQSMAFSYVLLANFNVSESQRQAMTPFLRGQIWQTCVGPRGFLKSRKTKGHFAHPVPLSQSDDKSPETKKHCYPVSRNISYPPNPKRELPKNSVSTPKSLTFVPYKLWTWQNLQPTHSKAAFTLWWGTTTMEILRGLKTQQRLSHKII